MEAKPIVKIAVQYPANLRVFSLSLLHAKYFTFFLSKRILWGRGG